MTEHIGFRCPDDILATIRERMETTGKGRTEILLEALRIGLDMPASDTEARLTKLEALVDQCLGKSAA